MIGLGPPTMCLGNLIHKTVNLQPVICSEEQFSRISSFSFGIPESRISYPTACKDEPYHVKDQTPMKSMIFHEIEYTQIYPLEQLKIGLLESPSLPFCFSSSTTEEYTTSETVHSSPIPDLVIIEPSIITSIRKISPPTIVERPLPLLSDVDIEFPIPQTIKPREKAKSEVSVPLEDFQPIPITQSKLFPQVTPAIPSTPIGSEQNLPVIITSREVTDLEVFDEIFDKCRVIKRQMKYVDIEINQTTGIIILQTTLENVISAATCFDTVYVLGTNKNSCLPFGHHSIKTRQFPSKAAALRFVRTLVEPSPNAYVREKESLHEHLLWQFPTITRSVAMNMLRNGNPISNKSFFYDQYPQMNTYVFKNLLDMPTMAYYSYQAANSAPKKKAQVHSIPDNESILAYIPDVVKVKAPRPVQLGRV